MFWDSRPFVLFKEAQISGKALMRMSISVSFGLGLTITQLIPRWEFGLVKQFHLLNQICPPSISYVFLGTLWVSIKILE